MSGYLIKDTTKQEREQIVSGEDGPGYGKTLEESSAAPVRKAHGGYL